MAWKKGEKKADKQNKIPHTKVLSPVRAPALIPAADSGDRSMGGPVITPLNTVVSPHIINIQRT